MCQQHNVLATEHAHEPANCDMQGGCSHLADDTPGRARLVANAPCSKEEGSALIGQHIS